jgi:hypothetical protein
MQPIGPLHPISRRRLLALAGSTAAALGLPAGPLAAQAPPAAVDGPLQALADEPLQHPGGRGVLHRRHRVEPRA